MLKLLKSFFRPKEAPATAQAPYKVETPPQPEPVKCGCGRSPSGNCVGLHKLSEAEWAVHEDNTNKTTPVVVEAKKPAAKKPAAKPAAKKPAAITAAPKKPRAKKPAAK